MRTIVIGVEFEQWRPLPGHEGAYSVSDLGTIRRDLGGKGTRAGRILRTRIRVTPSGVAYRYIDLYHKPRLVHRLVALAFHEPDPAPHLEVRHLDGDSLNNCASNLQWGTKSENMKDRRLHGTDPNARKTHCRNGHSYSSTNTYVVPLTKARRCRLCSADSSARYRRRR